MADTFLIYKSVLKPDESKWGHNMQGSISTAGAGRQCEWPEEGDRGTAEGAGLRQGRGPEGSGGGQAGC